MKKKVILHIGFTKTASTTMQHTFGQNRDALAAAGLSYARFSLNGRERPNHSIPFSYLFAKDPPYEIVHVTKPSDREIERQRHRKEFEAALESAGTVMFSAESVCIYPKATLKRIRDTLSESGFEVRVVSFVRPVVSYMTSLVQHHVKSGAPVALPYDRMPSLAIGRIESVFPDAEFYSFEDARKHPGGPTNFLLEKLGYSVNVTEVSPTNSSWSDNAVHLAGFINRFAPTVIRGRLNPLRKHADIRSISGIGGPRFALTTGDIDRKVLQKEIDWLERRFGEKFKEDLDKLPTEPMEWAPEQINEAVQAIRKLPLTLVPLVSAYFHTEARLQDAQSISKIMETVERLMFRKGPVGSEADAEE